MSDNDPISMFRGAERFRGYAEQSEQADDSTVPSATRHATTEPPGRPLVPVAEVGPSRLLPAAQTPAVPARRRGLLRRRRFPTDEDLAALYAAQTAIRQFTATRAHNVLVANRRSTGKTSTSLILGGVMAEIRGGTVAVTEVSEAQGDLYARAEGRPTRGLLELLDVAERIGSAGHLAGYTAPQTSRAVVVGSCGPRRELTALDVDEVRRLLDTYYQLTISDSGNNLLAASFVRAVERADAVVVPVTCTLTSIRAAQETVLAIRSNETAIANGLSDRIVLIATHDGADEDPRLVGEWLGHLAALAPNDGSRRTVLEVPYDPAIRDDTAELSLSALSERSRHAWHHVAQAVVDALATAPADPSLNNHL